MTLSVVIQKVNFKTILPIWRDTLWPGRKSPIRPLSSMLYQGGYDTSIHDKYADAVTFFAAKDGDETIGVFSGHPTSDAHYRGRGMWVRPDTRRRGIATKLITAVVALAKEHGCPMCWVIPRVTHKHVFEKAGFVETSQPFMEGVEFGPNIYMARALIPAA